MNQQTVGEFLHEKAGNMAKWLKESGNPVDLELGRLTQLQITALAQVLHDNHKDSIIARSFDGLLAEKENIPPELLMTVSWITKRTELHDKFWRYLALFSDTVA